MKDAQSMNATMSKDTINILKKTQIWLYSLEHMDKRLNRFLKLMLIMMILTLHQGYLESMNYSLKKMYITQNKSQENERNTERSRKISKTGALNSLMMV
jgi:hypothetical protein